MTKKEVTKEEAKKRIEKLEFEANEMNPEDGEWVEIRNIRIRKRRQRVIADVTIHLKDEILKEKDSIYTFGILGFEYKEFPQNDENYVYCIVCGKKLRRKDKGKTWIYIMYQPYCIECSKKKWGVPFESIFK